jgi:hypothetical protein
VTLTAGENWRSFPATSITVANFTVPIRSMPHSNDANETISGQYLHTRLRASRLADYSSFQIDRPVANIADCVIVDLIEKGNLRLLR